MPTAPAKTLSPAELAKLEHAFATDPASEAYKPLAEAYLGMGRFMEAMVVCKKGVKAHPNATEPRLLLARVYADQGKDKKAIEELQGALTVAPTDKVVLRLLGGLQLKAGEPEPGKQNLLKAYQADPKDAETLAVMQQHKVEAPKAKEPEPPTEMNVVIPAAGPGTAAPQPLAAAPVRASASNAPVLMPTAGPGTAAPRAGGNQAAPPRLSPTPLADAKVPVTGSRPAAQARPNGVSRPEIPAVRHAPVSRPQRVADEDEELDDDDTAPRRRSSGKRSGAQRAVFGVLVIAVPVLIGGYFFFGQWRARRNHEVKKALTEASEQLKHDSYDSYKKACEAAEKALEFDPDSAQAHAYLGYAYAVRWGEHGGGDTARKAAEDHLSAAATSGEDSSYLYAGQALMKLYAGKAEKAESELDQKVQAFDAQGRQSSLMYLTLGIIQMNEGDLERSQESLEKAQRLSPDDPRVYSALGTLYHRRGEDSPAWRNFQQALTYEKGHPESLLGNSLVMLSVDNPNFEAAAKMLKKLIDADPPPSPRQLAEAWLTRSLLVSRASAAIQSYKPEYQKELSDKTGVPIDHIRANAEMVKDEQTGFDLDKTDPELYLIKGQRLYYEGNFDGATAAIRDAIKLDPTRARSYAELARVLMLKPGGEKEARDALLTAMKAVGESPRLLTMLGQANARLGDRDTAISNFQKALADPKGKHPDARIGLASVYREKREFTQAQTALEKALQESVGQSTRVAQAKTELGRVYLDQGNHQKADEALTQAITADETYAPAYYWYARLLSDDKRDGAKSKENAQNYLRLAPRGEFSADAQRLAQ